MKELYQEALADVKKVKEVAEDNAKRAIIEAVTPRIREFIEQQLLEPSVEESGDDVELRVPMGAAPAVGLTADINAVSDAAAVPASAITPPDSEGKVTLDIDAMVDQPGVAVPAPLMGSPVDDEYEMSLESIDMLVPVLGAARTNELRHLNNEIKQVTSDAQRLSEASQIVRSSVGYRTKIAQTISRVEDMYGYVQESIIDTATKSSYETKLETVFEALNKLLEPKMSKNKSMVNEEDITMKLTGLPDDLDLDGIGVDLVTGEDGGDDEVTDDLDTDDASGDDFDVEDEDAGGGEDVSVDMGESRRLSDDTIVEVDAKMLRRELAAIRRLREEAVPSTKGNGVNDAVMSDFGGGADEGEPLDVDLPHKSDAPGALPLGEADGDLDEADEMDEADVPMAQIGDRRTRDQIGGSATSVPSKDKSNPAARHESLQRRLRFEKKIRENARRQAETLSQAVKKAHARGDIKRESLLRKAYANAATRFNESLARSNRLKQLVAESAQVAQRGIRSNNGPSASTESRTVNALRSELTAKNLFNAKLLYSNKVLQNESLSARQKAHVIEQLDAAQTVREARLVYESLSNTLKGTSKSVNEGVDRKVVGSSSRMTRPASTPTLNEGHDVDRWAKLAGIVK